MDRTKPTGPAPTIKTGKIESSSLQRDLLGTVEKCLLYRKMRP